MLEIDKNDNKTGKGVNHHFSDFESLKMGSCSQMVANHIISLIWTRQQSSILTQTKSLT